MGSSFTEIRKRQLARLGGAQPPSARAAIAVASGVVRLASPALSADKPLGALL